VPDFEGDATTELERKLGPLQVVCVAEAVSYSALVTFWILGNHPGVLLLGSVHGIIVLAFAGMVLLIRAQMDWTLFYALVVIATGPLGSIAVLARVRRQRRRGLPVPAPPRTMEGREGLDPW